MTILNTLPSDPLLLLPILTFSMVFGLVIAVTQRQSVVSSRLLRHRMALPSEDIAPRPAPARRPRSRPTLRFDRLSGLMNSEAAAQQARTLLKRAGNPMSVETYDRLRRLASFVLAPICALVPLLTLGPSLLTIAAAVTALALVPRLLAIALKRRAKQRAREMDRVIADVLDLLVVCVEGGQSLAAGLMQVANRMDNVAAEEFGQLLADINSGLSRREAFLGLADRCQSETLGIACKTIIQADKVGMSIASTLRTLSAMMRTRRRQAAETKARQAPIKMMPVLVGFMLPTLLALLLGPVALEAMQVFK